MGWTDERTEPRRAFAPVLSPLARSGCIGVWSWRDNLPRLPLVEEFGFFTSAGYCLALVAESAPEDVLSSLRSVGDKLSVVGAEAAVRAADGLGVQHDVDGVHRQPVAVAEAGNGWTVMLQAPGFLGISPTGMSEVVQRHDVVSHGADRFVWWSQGVERISFEPLLPRSDLVGVLADRQPADARAQIVTLIEEVGGIDLDETQGEECHHVAGSFALAERLSGVPITPRLLETVRFTVDVIALD